MNLHEYQAKELLRTYDLPLLKGVVFIESLSNLEKELEILKGPPWVVKSQIHAGGRGAGYFKNSSNKDGGVRVVHKKDDVRSIAKFMLGNTLVTKQTGPEGKKVNRIFVEEGCEIEREFYLSLLIDRSKSQLMLMISAAGGMNIEDVAQQNPEKIHITHFYNLSKINLNNELKRTIKISNDQFDELSLIVKKLVRVFRELDVATLEINPLVLNRQGRFILLDTKLSLDDNALFRHPELEVLKDITEEDPLELEASNNDMNYVKLDGVVGCMVNGAGLAMATMDMIKQFGEEPANFLDLGGSANKERAVKGFSIIQSDENVRAVLVNIFGGIIHCDMIAQGIVEAIKELHFNLPVVVRFQGTNAKEGRDIINQSSLNIVSVDDLTNAAKKAVELANQ